MKRLWFVVIFLSGLMGLYAIYSDGHDRIKVEVKPIGMTPRQFLGPNDPNLNLIADDLRDKRFSFVYTGTWSLERISEYRKKHPQEPAIVSSRSGSFNPGTVTTVFSNNPNPDPEFFRI